jgi:hypothetical protein
MLGWALSIDSEYANSGAVDFDGVAVDDGCLSDITSGKWAMSANAIALRVNSKLQLPVAF